MNQTVTPAELESLLSTHLGALVAMLNRRIPDDLRGAVGAEDVAQEAALEAFRSLDTFRPCGGESLRGWLWQIARHRLGDVIKAHRRLKRGGAVTRVEPTAGVLDALAAEAHCPARAVACAELHASLRLALASLPDACRQVIELRYVHGLPIAEAARRLGRTTGATAVLCNRALKLLRRAMDSGAACPLAA
jgi:RNA polymerase sigma-70 factor (ECF subfamily)